MIFAAPVNLGMSPQKYPAVKNVQALLHQIARVLGDKYDPANKNYNGGSAMQGNVDSPTVWTTYLIVRDGVAQIPAIGSLISDIVGAMESAGVLSYSTFKFVYLNGAENWINPKYLAFANQIDSALRGALSRLPSGGGGSGTQIPREIIQQVARQAQAYTSYPAGTFAIRDPGRNTYRIFTPIV